MDTASQVLKSYLDEVGWTVPDLADRAEVSRSVLYRVIDGTRGFGFRVASAVARATADAFSAGETKVTPLRAVDLCAAPRGRAA